MKKLFITIFLFCFLIFGSFGDTITETLIKQLKSSSSMIEKLVEKNLVLEEKLSEATEALRKSTDIIIKMKDRIEGDQVEIKDLRDNLDNALDSMQEHKYVDVGLAVTYPWGGQLLLGFDLPILPIGIFTTLSIHSENNVVVKPLFSLGIKINF